MMGAARRADLPIAELPIVVALVVHVRAMQADRAAGVPAVARRRRAVILAAAALAAP